MHPSFAIELHHIGHLKHAGWMDRLRSLRSAVGEKLDDLRAYRSMVSKDLDTLGSMDELSHLNDKQKGAVRLFAGLGRVSEDAQAALLRTADRLGEARKIPTEDAVQLAQRILDRTAKKVPSSQGSIALIQDMPFTQSRAAAYRANATAAPQLISLSPSIPAAVTHELGHVRDFAKNFPKGVPSFEEFNAYTDRTSRHGRGMKGLFADEIRANMHAVPELVREYGLRGGLYQAAPLAPAFGTYLTGVSSGFGQEVVNSLAPGAYAKWRALKKTSQSEERWFAPPGGKGPLDTLDRRSVRKFRKPNTRFLPPSLESGKSLR